ncbi:hypothetical protein WJ36_09745 [Burkholderia ubonensis]|uniref:hypothetical protein n=1 Tax=Burkholderia ubonensis TaxID=101571 RepID=UPI00075B5B63|nr:hypothetical protein [Burkholderia ubonensis]KVG83447.1 hypothetical protein WJ36_09745 [Burkholderia ubonensis]
MSIEMVERQECDMTDEEFLQKFRDGAYHIFEEFLDEDLFWVVTRAYEYGMAVGFYDKTSPVALFARTQLRQVCKIYKSQNGVNHRLMLRFLRKMVDCGKRHGQLVRQTRALRDCESADVERDGKR